MTATLQEPFVPRVAERRPTDTAPRDHAPTSAVEWAPPTNLHRRTILSQLLSLRCGPEGNSVNTSGLCVDLPGEEDRITIDREFALACPKVATEEALALERNLVKSKRCKTPLAVWRFEGLHILIEGHHRLFYCLKHQVPFRVEFLDLPDREAALQLIREEQIGRRNLSDEGAACQRGDHYNRERLAHGGRRATAQDVGASGQVVHLPTARRLAVKYGVDERTIRRDGKLADAMRAIVLNCGLEARHALLARGSNIGRAAIGRLAEMEACQQRDAIDMFFECGKLPPAPIDDDPQTVAFTLPTRLAEKLLRHFGVSDPADLAMALVRMKDEG